MFGNLYNDQRGGQLQARAEVQCVDPRKDAEKLQSNICLIVRKSVFGLGRFERVGGGFLTLPTLETLLTIG